MRTEAETPGWPPADWLQYSYKPLPLRVSTRDISHNKNLHFPTNVDFSVWFQQVFWIYKKWLKRRDSQLSPVSVRVGGGGGAPLFLDVGTKCSDIVEPAHIFI